MKSNRIFFEISRSGFGLRNLRYSASEQMKFHVSMNLSVKKENSMKVFSCFWNYGIMIVWAFMIVNFLIVSTSVNSLLRISARNLWANSWIVLEREPKFYISKPCLVKTLPVLIVATWNRVHLMFGLMSGVGSGSHSWGECSFYVSMLCEHIFCGHCQYCSIVITAKNSAISPNFLVWKFWGLFLLLLLSQ